MHIGFMMRSYAYFILTVTPLAVLAGCSLFISNSTFGESWTGSPIESLKHQWGAPQGEIAHPDGSREIRYEMPKWGCTYWFVSDPSGKIVSYRYKAEALGTCKPIG